MYQKQQRFLDIYKELRDYDREHNLSALIYPPSHKTKESFFKNPINHPSISIKYLKKQLNYEPIQIKNVDKEKSLSTSIPQRQTYQHGFSYSPTVLLENPILRPIIF